VRKHERLAVREAALVASRHGAALRVLPRSQNPHVRLEVTDASGRRIGVMSLATTPRTGDVEARNYARQQVLRIIQRGDRDG
jgi:hypothetical protein